MMNRDPADWFFSGGWATLILPFLLVICVVVAMISGNSGLEEIEPGEVAVLYNTLTGEEEVIEKQGLVLYLPIFKKLITLRIEPQVLVMQGDSASTEPNRAPALNVRARDGSMFHFPNVEVHYQIDPPQANEVVRCFGRGDNYTRDFVQAHTREISRQEFGRFTFLEIADPTNYNKATREALERLNERLTDCGLVVTQIIPNRPDFDDAVEQAIEDRQTAEQGVEVQQATRERLVAESGRRVQEVQAVGNIELQALRATLEAELKEAENNALATQREADKYAIENRAACFAERDATLARAAGNRDAYRQQAAGLAAKVTAVGQQGIGTLRLTIAEKVLPQLSRIKAQPYTTPVPLPLTIRQEGVQ